MLRWDICFKFSIDPRKDTTRPLHTLTYTNMGKEFLSLREYMDGSTWRSTGGFFAIFLYPCVCSGCVVRNDESGSQMTMADYAPLFQPAEVVRESCSRWDGVGWLFLHEVFLLTRSAAYFLSRKKASRTSTSTTCSTTFTMTLSLLLWILPPPRKHYPLFRRPRTIFESARPMRP